MLLCLPLRLFRYLDDFPPSVPGCHIRTIIFVAAGTVILGAVAPQRMIQAAPAGWMRQLSACGS
ncbi:MAG: hypothetical protein J0H48_09420 [Nitrosospira multiformis]|nr:hypothetical protein [Nitrosospira multiformis]